MTIEHIQCFLAVEKYESFSEAANELYIAQSTLSKQIKSIETFLHIKLFDRTTRKVKLTKEGQIFSKYAHIIAENYSEMLIEMRRNKDSKRVIVIGSVPVLDLYNLLPIFEGFEMENPGIQLKVMNVDRPEALLDLLKGAIDIALIRESNLTDSKVVHKPVLLEEMVLLVSKNHRFAEREKIKLIEAKKETFLFQPKHTGIYKTCIEECKKAGFQPIVSGLELDARSITIKVSQDKGISLMAYTVAKVVSNEDTKIIKLKDKHMIDLTMVVKTGKMDDDYERLIDYVSKHLN